MSAALKDAITALPHLRAYLLAAEELSRGDMVDRAEAVARLARLARETVSTSPIAAAALTRAVRDLAAELSGSLLEMGQKTPGAVARMLGKEPTP